MTSAKNLCEYIKSEEKCCYTKADLVKFRYSWSIKNLCYSLSSGGSLESPVFLANVIDSSEWRIQLYWERNKTLTGETCSTHDVGSLNAEQYEKIGKTPFNFNSLSPEDISANCFTIVCDMFKSKGYTHSERSESSLINNLSKLLENQKLSDVVLDVKGTEFRVHKALLASRSDVFASMFDNEFKENQTNRVDINDMDEDVVQELLKFIYTGQSPNLNKMAIDLLQASDKYALEDLKAMCVSELSHQINLDNAIQTLILADRHHVDELKFQSMHFIADNADSIRDTDGWAQIKKEYPLLYEEMLERKFFGGQHLKC